MRSSRRGDVNKDEKGEVLLLLPNLVLHPMLLNIMELALFFLKNEIAIIFLCSIKIWSAVSANIIT
jgi:hypothetical protein